MRSNFRLKYFLTIIVLFSPFFLHFHAEEITPTLPDPITASKTTFGTITSDYGPRNVTGVSNPHKAIDYQLIKGGKAYAVEAGKIETISVLGGDSYIKIGDWRYMHMIDNEYKGTDYWFQVYQNQDVLD